MKKTRKNFVRQWCYAVLLLLLFYPGTLLASQSYVKVKGRSMTIEQVIKQIEKNSRYVFFYNANDLRNQKNQTLDFYGPIEEVLKKVFDNSDVNYVIQDNEIILKVSQQVKVKQQTTKTIKGKVLDKKTHEPIIGATVKVAGKNLGATTDV
ncbi:MAG: STN and carboxypeptidase regulatory-like domain-containing protein, partial [Bacteroides sp.]